MKTIDVIKANAINNSFGINHACLNFVAGNRLVEDYEHIATIEESMKRGDFIPPVLVDEATLSIVEGQHRYHAACNIWRKGGNYQLNIMLGNFPNPLLSAIHYNRSSKKWTTDNYVKAYITDGRKSYELLHQFVHEHPLFISNAFGVDNINYIGAAQMLTGSPCQGIIPRGTLTITEQQYEEGEQTYNQLKTLVQATECKALMAGTHILAWLETRNYILSKMPFEKFVSLMNKYFVAPSVRSKKTWIAEYLRVASK
jgi:hypothetical protein